MNNSMNKMATGIRRCSKCITPASYPGASLDGKEVCYFCRTYDSIWGKWDEQKAQRLCMFEKLLEKAKRKKRQYDVIVPLSGGKDSTYVLYLMTKVYKMKTLAYTFENGFFTDIARQNVNKAIEMSGADHYVFKINPKKIMPLYKHFFKHTGLFCPVCMRGINLARFVLHRQYKIPLILRGTSKRTEEWITPEIFQDSSLYFFKNVLRKYPLNIQVKDFYIDRNIKEKFFLALYFLSRKRISMGIMDIQAPDFLDWDYNNIYQTIVKEFGWQTLPDRDEHVDCLVDPVVHYIRRKKVPELTVNTLRYSAMVRAGMMMRKKALELVNKEMEGSKQLPTQVEYLLSRLNITIDEFEAWADSSFRHMEFQKKPLLLTLFETVRNVICHDAAR